MRRNPADAKQVSAIILQQLGGAGKVNAMLGRPQMYYGTDAAGPYLSIKFKSPHHGPNHVKITLMPLDTYKVEFSKIHGCTVKSAGTYDDIYAEQLRPLFERVTGLYLSLGTMGRNNPRRRTPRWVVSALAVPGTRVVEGGEHGFWSVYKGRKWITDSDSKRGELYYGVGDDEQGVGTQAKVFQWFKGKANPACSISTYDEHGNRIRTTSAAERAEFKREVAAAERNRELMVHHMQEQSREIGRERSGRRLNPRGNPVQREATPAMITGIFASEGDAVHAMTQARGWGIDVEGTVKDPGAKTVQHFYARENSKRANPGLRSRTTASAKRADPWLVISDYYFVRGRKLLGKIRAAAFDDAASEARDLGWLKGTSVVDRVQIVGPRTTTSAYVSAMGSLQQSATSREDTENAAVVVNKYKRGHGSRRNGR